MKDRRDFQSISCRWEVDRPGRANSRLEHVDLPVPKCDRGVQQGPNNS